MAFITAPDFRIAAIDWIFRRPAQINTSAWTGRRTVVAEPWHGKWLARVQLAPLSAEHMRYMRSFFAKAKGSINTFRLYASEAPQNDNGAVTVSSTAAAGALTMAITGAATVMKEGQYVTVNGQLLILTADQAGSNITFEPPLRAQATAGTTVVTRRPYALVYLANADAAWGAELGPFYNVAFDVEEAILETDGAAPETVAWTFPANIFGAGDNGGYYNPSVLSSVWEDSARTTPASVNGPVGCLDDLSGKGNHLLQATTSLKPILRQTGSLYWLESDGVDDIMASAASVTFTSPAYAVAALKTLADTGSSSFWDTFGAFDATSSRVSVGIRSQNTGLHVQIAASRFNAGTSVIAETTPAITIADAYILENSTSVSAVVVFVQNVSGTTRTTTNSLAISGPDAIVLKLFPQQASVFGRAFYGGLIINRAPTAGEKTSVRTLIGALGGVTI